MVYKKNINALFLIILSLNVLSIKYKNIIFISIFWTLFILISGNAKRIKYTSGVSLFIRRSMYSFPLLLPIITMSQQEYKFNFYHLLSLLAIPLMFVFVNYNTIKYIPLLLEDENLEPELVYRTKSDLVSSIMVLIMAAISEEVFFRLYMLSLPSIPLYLKFFLNIVLFVSWHKLQNWGDSFKKMDIINEIILAMVSGLIFLWTNTIIYSILLHCSLNSVNMILEIKKLLMKIKKLEEL